MSEDKKEETPLNQYDKVSDNLGKTLGMLKLQNKQQVNPKLEQIINFLENQTILLNQLTEQASKTNLEQILNYLENQTVVLNQLACDQNQTVNDAEKFNKQILGTLAVNALQTRQQRDYSIDHELAAKTNYQKVKDISFEDHLSSLKNLMPDVYDAWLECFETGSAAYQKDPHGSCSVWGEAYAEGFRNFCSSFLKGRVLDIGSGPLGKPLYLQGYPSSLISAVEPLEVKTKVDFELVRCFNEFLPWPDKSFNTILNATSLDHVLSLDKAMEETHRVLADEGKFIIWIGSIPGAKPYDPDQKGFKPIDDFHLFHIDKKWFEPYLEKWFEIEERLEFPNASFSHVFYVLSKKET